MGRCHVYIYIYVEELSSSYHSNDYNRDIPIYSDIPIYAGLPIFSDILVHRDVLIYGGQHENQKRLFLMLQAQNENYGKHSQRGGDGGAGETGEREG